MKRFWRWAGGQGAGAETCGVRAGAGHRGPYSGREIETQRYCSRIVLPVEE